MVDLEVTDRVQLRQFVTPCAWCGTKYFAVLDQAAGTVTGYRPCSHCGQFFKFTVHVPTGDITTRRVRGRLKTGVSNGTQLGLGPHR